jgi:hypothetical protein
MNLLRLLFLGPLSILCFHSTAQVDDLMRDKNITWIAESYNDVVTDQVMEGKISSATNFVTPLKYVNLAEGNASEEFILQNIVLEAVKKGELNIYRDCDCKIATTYNDICTHDTITQINPNTYETENKIVAGLSWSRQFTVFRSHQIFFYNAKKAQFGLRTIAIAAIQPEYDGEGKGTIVSWTPLFWIKVADLGKKRKLSEVSITWAKRLTFKKGVVFRGSDSSRILKQTEVGAPMKSMFATLKTKAKIQFYSPEKWQSGVPLKLSERIDLLESVDTVSAIDPITHLMSNKIIVKEMSPDIVNHLQSIQNWYWDDKKKRLEIYLVATVPFVDVKNEAGDFLFRLPLFYRLNAD